MLVKMRIFVAAEADGGDLRQYWLPPPTASWLPTRRIGCYSSIRPRSERWVSAKEVSGRPVVDALAGADRDGLLARHLSLGLSSAAGGAVDGKIEVTVREQIFLAGISTVYNHDGQTMGRWPCCRRDRHPGLDRLKSDFVAGISTTCSAPDLYAQLRGHAATIDDPALEKGIRREDPGRNRPDETVGERFCSIWRVSRPG